VWGKGLASGERTHAAVPTLAMQTSEKRSHHQRNHDVIKVSETLVLGTVPAIASAGICEILAEILLLLLG
jgi:hypothetical protein